MHFTNTKDLFASLLSVSQLLFSFLWPQSFFPPVVLIGAQKLSLTGSMGLGFHSLSQSLISRTVSVDVKQHGVGGVFESPHGRLH